MLTERASKWLESELRAQAMLGDPDDDDKTEVVPPPPPNEKPADDDEPDSNGEQDAPGHSGENEPRE